MAVTEEKWEKPARLAPASTASKRVARLPAPAAKGFHSARSAAAASAATARPAMMSAETDLNRASPDLSIGQGRMNQRHRNDLVPRRRNQVAVWQRRSLREG